MRCTVWIGKMLQSRRRRRQSINEPKNKILKLHYEQKHIKMCICVARTVTQFLKSMCDLDFVAIEMLMFVN